MGPIKPIGPSKGPLQAHGPPKLHGLRGHCPPQLPPLGGPALDHRSKGLCPSRSIGPLVRKFLAKLKAKSKITHFLNNLHYIIIKLLTYYYKTHLLFSDIATLSSN